MTAGSIEVRALTWRPLGRLEPVLAGIDVSIRPGQRVLLTGASGAGKSTLLLALAGQLSPEDGELTGEVVVDGTVGLLLQDPTASVVAGRAGRDVAFGPENLSVPRASIGAAVGTALRASHFPYGVDRRTSALSGGEAQRLALAGAMALSPQVLLLDEPTAMLDAPASDAVRTAILAAAATCTLVVVDHQVSAWLPHVDRVLVLSSSGRLVADSAPVGFLSSGPARAPASPRGDRRPGTAPSPQRALLRARGVVARPLGWRDESGAGPVRGRTSTGGVLGVVAGQGTTGPLDAEVVSGQVLAITGPSGSGKSTLLAVLAGLTEPVHGEVLADPTWAPDHVRHPHRWGSTDLAARIAWVPQLPEHALVAATVRDEVLATSRALRHDGAAHDRAAKLVADLGLEALAEQDPHTLSGGEQRRLGLAAALAHEPQVLLLDEPTAGQDPATWRAVVDAVVAAVAAGTAVVIASHDDDLVGTLERTVPTTTVTLAAAQAAKPTPATPTPSTPTPSRAWPPAARCSPTGLLIAAALALVGSTQVDSGRPALAMVVAELLLAPLAIRSARAGLRRALPALVAATSLGASSWWIAGNDPTTALVAGARIFALVLPGALLSAWLDHSRLGDELAQWFRLPARPVVASVAALQQLDELGRQWRVLERVRHIRGLGPSRWPWSRGRHVAALTFALLVHTLRRAGRLAIAMDVRAFADARRRTWAEPATWRAVDTLVVLVGGALAVLPAVVR